MGYKRDKRSSVTHLDSNARATTTRDRGAIGRRNFDLRTTHVQCASRRRSGAAQSGIRSPRRRGSLSSRLGQSPLLLRLPLQLRALGFRRSCTSTRSRRGEKFSVATWTLLSLSVRSLSLREFFYRRSYISSALNDWRSFSSLAWFTFYSICPLFSAVLFVFNMKQEIFNDRLKRRGKWKSRDAVTID